jgi:hypothetical protein
MDAVHYAVIVCRSDNNIMIGVRAREKFLHQQQQHAQTEREDTAPRPCNLLARFAFESQLNLWSANQNLASSQLHFIQVVWELNQGHEICLDNIFFFVSSLRSSAVRGPHFANHCLLINFSLAANPSFL